ncbi:hypothetical protein NX059_011241 [Plenodomus lindquistii]|nr:hypothetical protein NX059_011241 [Plenodomus lindquistii]
MPDYARSSSPRRSGRPSNHNQRNYEYRSSSPYHESYHSDHNYAHDEDYQPQHRRSPDTYNRSSPARHGYPSDDCRAPTTRHTNACPVEERRVSPIRSHERQPRLDTRLYDNHRNVSPLG